VQWPFLMDEWGKGKAFQCKVADCGMEVNLYLRAKIGFCNCTTGIADDEELERLTDFNLVGNQLSAVGVGQPITVAWMKGRSRAYAIVGLNRSGKSAHRLPSTTGATPSSLRSSSATIDRRLSSQV
jgi:hypothetical protein